MFYFNTPIGELNGVGKARAEKLGKLGIFTVKDLIYHFPRAYENRGNVRLLSNASTDEPCSMILTVGTPVKSVKIRNGLTISKFKAFDESGAIDVVFFNSPYVKEVFHIGSEFRFWGKVTFSKKQPQLQNPKYEPYVEGAPLADVVPIYPLTQGLTSKIITKLILDIVDKLATSITDPLPESIRNKYYLPTLSFALKNVHFPSDDDSLSKALRRLAFDEMFMFGLTISVSSHQKSIKKGVPFSPCSMQPICDLLPYELTADQKNAVNDIYKDTVIRGDKDYISPMARILVGDVGSGKTICSILAIYLCVKSGYQAALMVPTEILAIQHYKEIKTLFDKLSINVELLTGQTKRGEKGRIYDAVKDGSCRVLIGTHSLISDKLQFNNLGLIVTDEQHRFGVGQRTVLREKSKNAHLLVMSATPIPRTLALAMYGDLDISRITQMPKGRIRVDTFVVDDSYRRRLIDFINKQVLLGGQCYIVCPSIESKDEEGGIELSSISSPLKAAYNTELKNAIEYTKELKQALPNLKIECLHGKMKAAEKDLIMSSYAKGDIDVLVSTTVIEVGINVPNASVMIIENAERFGLSQLHQLRGRVGRGTRKSYCILVSDMKTEKALSRLNVMKNVYDGFEIAEKDLIMRGPGDFFSSDSPDNLRQSGGFSFKVSKLCDDLSLFNEAFTAAKSLAESDPTLSKEENFRFKNEIQEIINKSVSTIS